MLLYILKSRSVIIGFAFNLSNIYVDDNFGDILSISWVTAICFTRHSQFPFQTHAVLSYPHWGGGCTIPELLDRSVIRGYQAGRIAIFLFTFNHRGLCCNSFLHSCTTIWGWCFNITSNVRYFTSSGWYNRRGCTRIICIWIITCQDIWNVSCHSISNSCFITVHWLVSRGGTLLKVFVIISTLGSSLTFPWWFSAGCLWFCLLPLFPHCSRVGMW